MSSSGSRSPIFRISGHLIRRSKSKTGFLTPFILAGTKYGIAVQTPFFWNLAPDYDITVTPMPTTKQGLMMLGEWRQRLLNGSYNIRAAGIFQTDREAFAGTEGDRNFRGAVDSKGDFRLSEKWFYGWDAAAVTDSAFFPDYKVPRGNATEIVSQAYLFGRGDRSYFDARVLHYYGLSPLDVQTQLPIVHPLVDYKYVYGAPVFGGELSYNINLTSLSRQRADFDPITQAAATTFFADGKPLATATIRSPSFRKPAPIACCAVFPARTRDFPQRPTGGARSSTRTGRCSRPSRSCARTSALRRSTPTREWVPTSARATTASRG